ncbi:MAG: GlmU family protein [Bacteroidetes bacterium]|nr:GlmU family protein [Bacteroidota bacterium]
MLNYILNDIPENWINLLPLTYTRPISDLRIGILTLKEKWELLMDIKCSVITEDYLSDKYNAEFGDENILINSAVIPTKSLIEQVQKLKRGQLLKTENEWIAIYTKDIASFSQDEFGDYEAIMYSSSIDFIHYPWQIFQNNGEQIKADYSLLTQGKKSADLSQTNTIIGDQPVFIEGGAQVECTVLNASQGPIYIGHDAIVMEGSLIQGPFALGDHSTLKMGTKVYPGTTIGPHCKVGGEINNSVFWGYSNKAHDGFIGNSVIGEWCNLGAGSNNSNLKNNYEQVKIWNYGSKSFVDSGSQFCGLFMGDHSKCGINSMFNTGTVVGVSANIFGAGFPRTFIPSFTWGGASGVTTYLKDKAFRTMDLVMQRRNLKLTDKDKKILSHIFEKTNDFRH